MSEKTAEGAVSITHRLLGSAKIKSGGKAASNANALRTTRSTFIDLNNSVSSVAILHATRRN
jgi:hypothetical protein